MTCPEWLETRTREKLFKDGSVKLTGCWSEKNGKTYDATVVLNDDGQKVSFILAFGGKTD